MKRMRLALVLLAFAVAFPATAHGQTTSAEAPICEFGLVLSGGGARGIAHIGVLEVFEQEGIVPDCIVGASMGSIVGSLYAAGHTIDEILQLMDVLSWRSLFTEPVNRSAQPIVHRLDAQRTALRLGLADGALRFPPSALNDSMINRLLIEALAPANFQAGRDFAALPIPFRTVGTDLRSGNRIVLREGDLARAVRASMSVPLAYSPVEWGDALLVDGGLADNLPVSLAREMGATFVVAIDVSTPITDDIATDMVGVTKRIVDLLFAAKNSLYREPPELTIVPELHDHGFADYSEFDHLIEAGRTAARAAIDSIPERYRGRSTERPRIRDIGRRTVASVEVTGTHFLKPSLMAHELGVEAGEQLDFKRALDGLDQVNSTGLVQKAWVDIRDVGNDQVVVALHVVEDYRHTADLGLAYQSDDQVQGFLRFETKSPFGAGERLRLTAYGSGRDTLLSAGLRSAELFGVHLGYHVAFDFHEEKPKVFGDEGHFITRAEFQRQHVKVLFDFPFGTRHVFETGFRLGTLKFREQLGLTYPEDSFRQRVLVGRYVWDDLDSLVLPTRGRFIRALGEYNAESLGADIGYLFVDLYARDAWTLGPLMFEARLRYGYGSDDLPLSEQFRIGGPELIPGVARDERWGKQALAASLTVGRDLYSLLRVYGRVGGGNVWDRQREINWNGAILGAGLGATLATPLGPMQLDYGWAQGGRNRLMLSFGWQTQWVRDISR